MRTRAVIPLLVVLAGCGGGKPAERPHRDGPVVLGRRGFVTGSVGWGEAHPRSIAVGGDPALVIDDIRWHGWGSPRASGVGRASAFTGNGGDTYPGKVRVELRAYRLGRCTAAGPRAYLDLRLRMPTRPGAPMGPWFVLGGAHGLCRRD